MKILFILFILLVSFREHLLCDKINIITYKNTAGLTRDIKILIDELTKLGHCARFVSKHSSKLPKKVDINIFIEGVDERFFSSADKNYFIPNPEWYYDSHKLLPRLDMILCKTREAQRIFKQYNPNSVYMSFTCEDRYDPTIQKEYDHFFHLAGASPQKGSQHVAAVWKKNADLPLLHFIQHRDQVQKFSGKNIAFIDSYITDKKLLRMQNNCGIHLCPSETEGFGHYIYEALSTGAIVITTNAPPMNGFVSDTRCLVQVKKSKPQGLGINYYIDRKAFEATIRKILQLPREELETIRAKNRQLYLKNDQFFKKKLKEIFKDNSKIP